MTERTHTVGRSASRRPRRGQRISKIAMATLTIAGLGLAAPPSGATGSSALAGSQALHDATTGIGCNGGDPARAVRGTVTAEVNGSSLDFTVSYIGGQPNQFHTIELFEADLPCFPDNAGKVPGINLTTDANGDGSVSFSVAYPHAGYNGTIGDGLGTDQIVLVLDNSHSLGAGDQAATRPISLAGGVPDSDGDGVDDDVDAFPNDPSESADNDGDGVGDNADVDDDNDDQSDTDETACGSDHLDPSSTSPDFDADNLPDCVDPDDDNDGVDDLSDSFPTSDRSATVVIDSVDTEVANQILTDGASFNDLIADAADQAGNHGRFVRVVAHMTKAWKAAGLITGAEKGSIQSAAAQSNLS